MLLFLAALINQHKYMVMTQKNVLYRQKFDKSTKWADSAKLRCVSKKVAELSKCLMMTQQR